MLPWVKEIVVGTHLPPLTYSQSPGPFCRIQGSVGHGLKTTVPYVCYAWFILKCRKHHRGCDRTSDLIMHIPKIAGLIEYYDVVKKRT